MKLFAMIAAAGVLVSGLAPVGLASSADAQQRVVVRERTVVTHDRPGYRQRSHVRRVCTNRVRNGHRVRTCRTVRRSR